MSYSGFRNAFLAASLIFVVGCAKGPVDSGNITITITGNEGDIRVAGFIYKPVNISTGSGNAWGNFIQAANAECGTDPLGMEITSVSATSATAFEDFISGALTIVFSHNTSGGIPQDPQADVASVTNPTGTAAVSLPVLATRATLDPLLARLIGGDFEVTLKGATNLTGADNLAFDVDVTINARAHC